jgi:hypothetical protein
MGEQHPSGIELCESFQPRLVGGKRLWLPVPRCLPGELVRTKLEGKVVGPASQHDAAVIGVPPATLGRVSRRRNAPYVGSYLGFAVEFPGIWFPGIWRRGSRQGPERCIPRHAPRLVRLPVSGSAGRQRIPPQWSTWRWQLTTSEMSAGRSPVAARSQLGCRAGCGGEVGNGPRFRDQRCRFPCRTGSFPRRA